MQAFAKNMLGYAFAGALLRPLGPALKDMMEKGIPVDYNFTAAEKAGYELIVNGIMSIETLRSIGKDLLPLDLYIQSCNYDFQKINNCLKK